MPSPFAKAFGDALTEQYTRGNPEDVFFGVKLPLVFIQRFKSAV